MSTDRNETVHVVQLAKARTYDTLRAAVLIMPAPLGVADDIWAEARRQVLNDLDSRARSNQAKSLAGLHAA